MPNATRIRVSQIFVYIGTMLLAMTCGYCLTLLLQPKMVAIAQHEAQQLEPTPVAAPEVSLILQSMHMPRAGGPGGVMPHARLDLLVVNGTEVPISVAGGVLEAWIGSLVLKTVGPEPVSWSVSHGVSIPGWSYGVPYEFIPPGSSRVMRIKLEHRPRPTSMAPSKSQIASDRIAHNSYPEVLYYEWNASNNVLTGQDFIDAELLAVRCRSSGLVDIVWDGAHLFGP